MRTYRPEVHEAGEGDDPEVHGVDNVTTIELGEGLALDVWVSERRINRDLTKRPSANQLFTIAIASKIELIVMDSRYPNGPGGSNPTPPANWRLLM